MQIADLASLGDEERESLDDCYVAIEGVTALAQARRFPLIAHLFVAPSAMLAFAGLVGSSSCERHIPGQFPLQ